MPVIELVLGTLARDLDLLDIRHDDVVANVAGRLKDGLVLPAQQRRDLRGKPPKDLALCVDKVPSSPDLCKGLILVRSRPALRERTEPAPGRLDRPGARTTRATHGARLLPCSPHARDHRAAREAGLGAIERTPFAGSDQVIGKNWRAGAPKHRQ